MAKTNMYLLAYKEDGPKLIKALSEFGRMDIKFLDQLRQIILYSKKSLKFSDFQKSVFTNITELTGKKISFISPIRK